MTGDYEAGPVRRLTLRSPVAPRLKAPGRAYAGYAFFVTAQAAGAPDGTTAVVQRRSGSRWRSAGTATVLGGEAEATVVLPRGDQQIRVGLAIGGQQVTSAVRARQGAPRPELEHQATRRRALQGQGRRALGAPQGDRPRASAA